MILRFRKESDKSDIPDKPGESDIRDDLDKSDIPDKSDIRAKINFGGAAGGCGFFFFFLFGSLFFFFFFKFFFENFRASRIFSNFSEFFSEIFVFACLEVRCVLVRWCAVLVVGMALRCVTAVMFSGPSMVAGSAMTGSATRS